MFYEWMVRASDSGLAYDDCDESLSQGTVISCCSDAVLLMLMSTLQSVLRSAARLVLQLPKRSHALERMQAELHWLVYPHRLYYKVGVISFKCLHGLAPPYLSTRLIKVSDVDGRSHLRSASDGQLDSENQKLKQLVSEAFISLALLSGIFCRDNCGTMI